MTTMPARTKCLRTKLGAASVTLVFLVQVMGLCVCGSRARVSTDPVACCPRPPLKPGGASAPGPMSSLTDDARGGCCSEGLYARTDVRLDERERLPAPAPYAVSSTTSFATLADQSTPFGRTASARARASSPPRSTVLRI